MSEHNGEGLPEQSGERPITGGAGPERAASTEGPADAGAAQEPAMPEVRFVSDTVPVNVVVPDPERAPQWHKRYGDLKPPPRNTEIEREMLREGVEPYPTKTIKIGEAPAPSLIVPPDVTDVEAFARDRALKRCGNCRHFDPHGMDAQTRAQLAATLTEARLRGRHLGYELHQLGRCAMDAGLITGVQAKACDQFAVRKP